jgi:hypothetical protein
MDSSELLLCNFCCNCTARRAVLSLWEGNSATRFRESSRRISEEKGCLTMSLKVHECRISADECEKRAAVTSDPALKQSYASLAKEWRDIAIQLERLESQMEALKAHKNSI